MFLSCLVVFVSFSNLASSLPRINNVFTSKEQTSKHNEDQLIFVQTIFRHGDRYPLYIYKNNPNQADSWPTGSLGNLSPTGMDQQLRLGKKLRRRYRDFFSPKFTYDEIYVRSSEFNRTLASALSQLIGFYSGTTKRGVDYPDAPGWPLNYVPVPVHSIPRDQDHVVLGMEVTNCERFRRAWNLITLTPEYEQMEQKYQEIVREAEKVVGNKLLVKVREYVYNIIDNARIDKLYGLKPTPDMTTELFNGLSDLETEITGFQFGRHLKSRNGVDFSREMAVPLGGGLLNEIIDRMSTKVRCLDRHPSLRSELRSKRLVGLLLAKAENEECLWINRLKMYAYSGHDFTLSALFSTFEFLESNWNRPGYPSYTSCIAIELRRNTKTGRYYVKVLYIFENETVDITSDIGGCERDCTFDRFVQRSQPFLLRNKTDYCESNVGVY
ncbi:Acid phosphatase [Aphelenchoides besseyi]|nr:Acid phosphatase [Aphelenchoides besseyi]KAI6195299.1 Acid phosphatase [Aphelenchoides besseyi]